jgi:hypothetical protein
MAIRKMLPVLIAVATTVAIAVAVGVGVGVNWAIHLLPALRQPSISSAILVRYRTTLVTAVDGATSAFHRGPCRLCLAPFLLLLLRLWVRRNHRSRSLACLLWLYYFWLWFGYYFRFRYWLFYRLRIGIR